ncbi:MAG TPA: TMEM175 family protein [Pyrinomonadaceae bacterium]|nr:TMEM175 family protein [Pyrinomonadaceae bacterium]
MLREPLVKNNLGAREGFRWRGDEISRVEALSDAVFGFAITLLVVSLEVPQTFDELLGMMRGFIPFAISAAMLFLVWYQHYIFFRRYGLEDTPTVLLNAVLLFVVLFYVYPLKFLWTFLTRVVTGGGMTVTLPNGERVPVITAEQTPAMMIVFGLGYVAVFGVFVVLYLHAYRKRHELQLNAVEVFDTRTELQSMLCNVGIGLLSIGIAASGIRGAAPLAGWSYALIGVVLSVHGVIRGKMRKKLEQPATVNADAV